MILLEEENDELPAKRKAKTNKVASSAYALDFRKSWLCMLPGYAVYSVARTSSYFAKGEHQLDVEHQIYFGGHFMSEENSRASLAGFDLYRTARP